MNGKRKTFLLLALFLFCLTLLGATPKNKVNVTIIFNDEIILNCEYKICYDNFFNRIFGGNIQKKIKKLRGNGYTDDEIIKKLFPMLCRDINLIESDFYIEPLSATVNFNVGGNRLFTYNKEKNGQNIDKKKLQRDIIDSVNDRKTIVTLKVNVIKPLITIDDLKKVTVKRGEFTTHYGFSSKTRKNNIERASNSISGTILKPNDVFSFNNVVGQRTAERGFQEAPIIVDGRYVGGIGGGVCQVSTTLYNTVLYSDLSVLSVNRHTLPVKYVAPSFDAMVSSGSDLKFINDTQSDIYILSDFDGDDLTFTIYGAPKKYDISLVSEKVKNIPCETEVIKDDTMFIGEEKVLFAGADGLISRGYIIRKQDNKIVSKILIRRDTYIARNRVVARGLKEQNDTDIDSRDALI